MRSEDVVQHPFIRRFCSILLAACGCLFWSGCGGERGVRDGKVHLVLSVPADERTRPMYRGVVADFMARHPNIECKSSKSRATITARSWS